MNGIVIMVIAMLVLGGAYLTYGRYLAKTWGIDPKAKTPAYTERDGVDYEPADTGVVFGHQFASIAGAGPINGPIQAAMFGWAPVLMWVLIGGVFFGAVQDFASMYASVKNKGRTIGYIIELYIGKTGKRLFLLFTWLFSVLVVAAFADIVAKTFIGIAETGERLTVNGSVATTSLLFIAAAVGLGFVLRYAKLQKWANTALAIGLLVACIAVGLAKPVYASVSFWHALVFAYVFIASVAPVWALLQPRDYLNSYLLVAMIAAAVVGVFVYNPAMNLNAFNGFAVNGQTLFPYLFVTIACGAVSGFHALVSSGTASKQIKNEKSMLPISFGAMLLESMLAVIALIAAGFMAQGGVLPAMTQPQIFAGAVASFLAKVGIPYELSATLITLAVSAFALTSLDSVARVGRLAFQEFFLGSDTGGKRTNALENFVTNKYFATLMTLAVAFILAKAGYASIWPLFGSANQLLSALALIACAVFLKKTNRKGFMLWIPMGMMLAVTLSMLAITIASKFQSLLGGTSASVGGDILQVAFAIALFALGIIVAIMGIGKLAEKKAAEATAYRQSR